MHVRCDGLLMYASVYVLLLASIIWNGSIVKIKFIVEKHWWYELFVSEPI